jgi:hypothetical protein
MRYPQGVWKTDGSATTQSVVEPGLEGRARIVRFPPKERFYDLNGVVKGTVMPYDTGYGMFWESFYHDLKNVPRSCGVFKDVEDAKVAVLKKL